MSAIVIRPEAPRAYIGEVPRGGHYQVTTADLRHFPSLCPRCHGPAPRLTIDVDPMLLSSGHQPAANTEAINGFKRYLGANLCSGCELRDLLAALFPGPASAITSPVEQELAALQAALAARDAPEAPVDAQTPRGGLFDVGRVLVTVAGASALYRCRTGTHPGDMISGQHVLGYPDAMALVARHAKGDHGLVGHHGDGDVELGSGANPLASVLDRNVAAIAEGYGGIRSVFPLVRMETRRTGELGTRSTALAERVELMIRSELGINTTVVGLVNEIQGAT